MIHRLVLAVAIVGAGLAACASLEPAARVRQEPAAAEVEASVSRSSFFAEPLCLDVERPEVRALRHLAVSFAGARDQPSNVTRSKEEARKRALALKARLDAGASYDELVRTEGDGRSAKTGGHLGSFVAGVLQAPANEFLFAAKLGELSQVIELDNGFQIFQRVEAYAGCRQLLVSKQRGDDARRRAFELFERAQAGEDFQALVREASDDDDATKATGGALSVFERGPNDRLVKAAAFNLAMGAVSAPIESLLGWHLIQRVPVDSLPSSLRETTQVRAELIFLSHSEMPGINKLSMRSPDEAKALVDEFHARVLNGASFRELSDEANEDRDGQARGADLGWLHRRNPGLNAFLDRLFTVEPGHLFEPLPTRAGWVLLRRSS